MLLTQVKGQAVSTAKVKSLDGRKLLLVEIVTVRPHGLERTGRHMICVDAIGVGEGQLVLTVTGSAARYAPGMDNLPADAVIVGIVDQLHAAGRSLSLDDHALAKAT